MIQSTQLHKLQVSLKKKSTEMNSSISDGPFFATLEKSLKACNVKKQAYQGGTFVGNHMHKLLKVTYMITLDTLTSKILFIF